MRQLTAYASYLDNIGAPLVGRARFYNLDGEPSVVYARDNATDQFIPNGTSVFTNSSGQLEPQVFLDDHDYLVVFDKYIGHGTMSEDDEQESWDEQGSAIDKYNTVGVTLTADGCRAVSTMAELKQTHAMSDPEVILLLGYNAAGDAPAMYYRWDSTETDPDDGGSVVAVQGVQRGRWVMVSCPRYLDVRNFGAFPLSASSPNTAQRYAIQNAGAYARRNGCGLYFPVTDTAIYYDISSLSLYDIDSATTARVFCINGLSATIDGIVYVRCGGSTNGSITLVNPTVHSYWEGTYANCTLAPTERLVLDSQLNERPRTWQGIKVDIERFTNGLTFDNCEITSFKKITGTVTIMNSEVKSEWFADNYDWANLTIQGCTILIQNCKDANTYITLKNKQQEPDYGDLRHSVVSNISLLQGCMAENAVFENVGLAGITELRNIKGTVSVSLSASILKLNAVDCWLTFTGSGTTRVDTVTIRRGSLEGTKMRVVTAMYLDNVDLKAEVDCTGANCYIIGSRIVAPVVGSEITLLRNDISAMVTQRDKDGVVFVNCDYNRFIECGFHNVSPITSNSIVVGHWVGNDGLGSYMPIIIDRTGLVADDSAHIYTYANNSGSFLKDFTEPKAVNLTIRTAYYIVNVPGTKARLSSLGTLSLVRPWEIDSDLGQTTAGVYSWGGNYFDAATFFRVGTTGFRVELCIDLKGPNASVMPARQVLEAEFESGYVFRLKTPVTAIGWTDDGLHSYPSKYGTVALYGLAQGHGSSLPDDYSVQADVSYKVLDRHA